MGYGKAKINIKAMGNVCQSAWSVRRVSYRPMESEDGVLTIC
jgi:hypothetical protein